MIEDLKVLLQEDVTSVKDQVEHLKTQYYRTATESAEAAQEALSNAADAAQEAVQPHVDALEEQFKELLAEYKTKRAEVAVQQAKEQAANLARKRDLLAEMKTLAEGETDGVMDNLKRMRELQAEWKNTGAVPADKVQELRKDYQRYQEQFYDLVKINIELRDLDFKKNLEMKTLLCEAAERLRENDNIVEASRALQQLHDEWAEIGPVARDLREDLWNRFKEASSAINKKHQAYFDQLHAKEKDNLERKQALIEQMKQIVATLTPSDEQKPANIRWEKLSEQVQNLQNEWRSIGFAPKKYNQQIYSEFRSLCDTFFKAKTAHYKGLRSELSNNLAKKRALVEKAEALAESQDWQATAEAIRTLQAEWKTVGPIARKYSDELWTRFTAACDSFFEEKRKANKGERVKGERMKGEKAKGTNLYRLRDTLIQEIKVAENNILFFTAKSKTANKLVDSMQQKIDALKKRLADLQEEIEKSER